MQGRSAINCVLEVCVATHIRKRCSSLNTSLRMPELSHQPRNVPPQIEGWLAGVSHLRTFPHATFLQAILFSVLLFGCQRSEQTSTSTATDPTTSATTQSKHGPTGGPSGTPVVATRLRGATLSWIGNRKNSAAAFRWHFEDRTFALLADGPTLPADLIQLLTGTSGPRQRIDGEWQTTDGRHLKLKSTPATDNQNALQVTLSIETAGLLRVNMGDGRQYNLLRQKTGRR